VTQCKLLEVRDAGAFIPVLAVRLSPSDPAQEHLLCCAGHQGRRTRVLMTPLVGGDVAEFDPRAWGNQTLCLAHQYITQLWDSLSDGDVVDTAWIAGERLEPARSGLPELPPIPPAVLCLDVPRPYTGPIEPGMIFAWEHDKPHARQLCQVTRITGPGKDIVLHHAKGTAVLSGGHEEQVVSRAFPGNTNECSNDVSRFREAVVPTMFKPMEVKQ
jgi:hypothetical protein